MSDTSTISSEKEPLSPPAKKGFSRAAWFAVIIILLVVAWLGMAAYQLWWFHRETVSQWDAIGAQFVAMQQLERANQEKMQQVLAVTGGVQENWKLHQAAYLIRVANINLSLQQNAAAAIVLLNMAARYLKETKDPHWQAVSTLTLANIKALQGEAKLDILPIYADLESLKQAVTQLPILLEPLEKQSPSKALSASSQLTGWRKVVDVAWQALKSVVVIRYHDDEVQLLLTRDQRNLVRLNLQILLSQVEWSVMQHQPEIYRKNLTAVRSWMTRYFLSTDKQTKQVLQTLDKLQTQPIAFDLPDMAALLKAVDQAEANMAPNHAK